MADKAIVYKKASLYAQWIEESKHDDTTKACDHARELHAANPHIRIAVYDVSRSPAFPIDWANHVTEERKSDK